MRGVGKLFDLKMLSMIFLINFTYVTVSTIRLMLMMKGYRLLAPLLSMVEITIYVLGLSLVLDRLDNLFNLFIYALGFGVGILMGIKIEDYLALGYIMTTVILPSNSAEERTLPNALREEGYGVTQSLGEGLAGPRVILEILALRKNERNLYQVIQEVEPRAFIITHEPKYISGGFWSKKVQKRIK